MPKLSRYVKAYQLNEMSEYSKWNDSAHALAKTTNTDEFVFLHESLIVTAGIYADDKVIFDATTDDWKDFCRNQLKFAVPKDIEAIESPDNEVTGA